MAICGRCGRDNPTAATFCMTCGHRLTDVVAPAAARKTVTVLFVDIADSTALGRRLDAESYRRVLARYVSEVSGAVERHGGMVEKFAGDAVMAVFGVPVLHEDDALRAVRAATEITKAIDGINDEIEESLSARIAIRTGVNTGEVVTGDPHAHQALVSGDAVNVAAKLEEAAPAGRILIGPETYRLVRDAVQVQPMQVVVKGEPAPVEAYEVVTVIPGAPGHARRLESPLVGRDGELGAILRAHERARSERRCRLVTVLGPAGVGKSRLVTEAVARIGDDATILWGRCLPYGEGITFWPAAEAVKQATGIAEGDSPEAVLEKIAACLSADDEPRLITRPLMQMVGITQEHVNTGEIFWAMRRLFEALARTRPLVCVFDDIHWAEPTFLELIEHLVDWARTAPIVVVCMARPDLLDENPEWGSDKRVATEITLGALTDAECDLLIDNLLGSGTLAEDVRARILPVAEGTPLFLEELVAMLVDEGVLRREDGVWSAVRDLTELRVPVTIDALLTARLDKLAEPEREVVTHAAVMGKVFYAGAIGRLVSERTAEQLETVLNSLVAKQLVQKDAPFAGEAAYRFRHILIQDAAYRALPKELRAQLHEKFAGWLEWNSSLRFGEFEEIVGYHLEQAVRYRRELGEKVDRVTSLASSASTRLGSAGRRALPRGDVPAAANLLERAARLLRREDVTRLELLLDICWALLSLGDKARTRILLDEVELIAEEIRDKRLAAHAAIQRYWVRFESEVVQAWADPARSDAERAITIFEHDGDLLGLARAYSLLAHCEWYEYRLGHAEALYEKAYQRARQAGDPGLEERTLVTVASAKLWGPTPAPEGIEWCERTIDSMRGNAWVQRALRLRLAGLLAVHGNADEARAVMAETMSELDDMGLRAAALTAREICGYIELLAGDPVRAEGHFRTGVGLAEDIEETMAVATFSGHAARSLLEQARFDEALHFLDAAEAIGGDPADMAMWRSRRARIVAERGEVAASEEMARRSLDILLATDTWPLVAEGLITVAEVLTKANHPERAVNYIRTALGVFEQKGVVPWATDLRVRLKLAAPSL